MLWGLRCSLCDRLGASPCDGCAQTLIAPLAPVAPAGCESLVALFAYNEQSSRLVAALKFDNDRSSMPWAAAALAGSLSDQPLDALVTWAPTTTARRRARGYDQAELLAKKLARVRGSLCRLSLLRITSTSQTGRTAESRVALAPAFIASKRVRGQTVLLLDDVCTTGATLEAAANALNQAGAAKVVAAVLAYTDKRVGMG